MTLIRATVHKMHDVPPHSFRRYAGAVLAFNILVVLWGAFVRASGSGAGCGAHWPLCNGVVIQHSPRLATLIEFGHRASSGVALILVAGLLIWAFRRFPRQHAARHGAALSSVFLLTEAALGAGLVLLALVAQNASVMRAVAISLHLTNTFLLLASLTYVTWYAFLGRAERFKIKASRSLTVAILAATLLFLSVGIAGAIVALGDTLFPATSLAAGLVQDTLPTAHFLIKLRAVHPLLALIAAAYGIGLGAYLRAGDTRPIISVITKVFSALVVTQVALGVLNMVLLAPTWMQLVHLFVADGVWISLVVLALESLTQPGAAPELAILAPTRA